MDILEYGKEIEDVITDEKSLKIILEKLDEFYKKEILLSEQKIDEIE